MINGSNLTIRLGPPARTAAGILSVLMLTACSGLTQLQDSISKFSQGTHAVSTTEGGFLRAVRTADCSNQFYQQAYSWATGKTQNFDIAGTCKPTVLTDDQLERRQVLMVAITLYADQMAALATSDNDKSLDANSQNLASKINALAKQGGVKDLSIASEVESAVIAISQMVLDWKVQSDIKMTAKNMDPQLSKIIDAIKSENTNFAAAIDGKMEAVEVTIRPIVATAPHNATTARFFSVVQARSVLQSANPFGLPPLAATPAALDPSLVPDVAAAQLNSALDGVAKANQAIANSSTGGIVAAVNDLIARAHAAQAMQIALNKS